MHKYMNIFRNSLAHFKLKDTFDFLDSKTKTKTKTGGFFLHIF